MKIPVKQGLKHAYSRIAIAVGPGRYENSSKTRIETRGTTSVSDAGRFVVMKIPVKQGLKLEHVMVLGQQLLQSL